MPDLVKCPACGCGMTPEVRPGRRTRCIACGQSFDADAPPPPPPEPDSYPLHGPLDGPPSPERRPSRGLARQRLPLCPGCHRPVGWEAPGCPHCGHAFDLLEAGRQAAPAGRRRDGEDHRGGTIELLGTLSLLFGALALCSGPFGGLVALGTGLPALAMARRDLEAMRTGSVDPAGRAATESGWSRAAIGVALGVVCGVAGTVILVAVGW